MAIKLTALMVLLLVLIAGCIGGNNGAEQQDTTTLVSGSVRVDGSSTVFPITEAVAEEFQKLHRDLRVTVGISGTGGGFKKFCNGETDINDASREIRESEMAACSKNGVDWIELTVAFDGLSVVVNPANDFIQCTTVEELRRLWEPGSSIKRWSEIRSEWPDKEIHLYGPGPDSGTFDYFTGAIIGKEKASRPDYTASEDDNVLVQGIGGDPLSLGYLGYAYYYENPGKLKLVGIETGTECVEPNAETIADGSYTPLSRPLFIYVNKKSLQRPEVREFVEYYLTVGAKLVSEVGYVEMPGEFYQEELQKIEGVR